MFTFEATPAKLGIRIMGNRNDFHELHENLWKCWKVEEMTPEESISYLGIISYFSYEVRKTFMGARIVKMDGKALRANNWNDDTYDLFEKEQSRFQVGVEFSWPQYLFILSSWWECFRQYDCPLNLLHTLKLFENEADHILLNSYKKIEDVRPYLHGAIYAGHPYLMHVMNEVHANYIEEAYYRRLTMKQLASHMERASVATESYKRFTKHLETTAKKLSCTVAELRADIDDAVYMAKL